MSDVTTIHDTLIRAIAEGGPHDATMTFGDLATISDKMASWFEVRQDGSMPEADDLPEGRRLEHMSQILVELVENNNRLVGEIATLQGRIRAADYVLEGTCDGADGRSAVLLARIHRALHPDAGA